jgi:hypothetical protein
VRVATGGAPTGSAGPGHSPGSRTMRLVKRHAEPLSGPNAPAPYGSARALSAEAMRLDWNRASRRIIRKAQERVALEPADALMPGC